MGEGQSLIEILISKKNHKNSSWITTILKIFIDSAKTADEGLFDTLLLPPGRDDKQSLLLQMIDSDCHEIISHLLANKDYQNVFWEEVKRGERISRKQLESHSMTAQMVAAFNCSSSCFFINLSNHKQSKPMAFLIYTEEHKDKRQNLEDADMECGIMKDALESACVKCIEWDRNGKLWKKMT